MTPFRPARSRSLLLVLAAALAVAAFVGLPAFGASTSKPYAITVTPHGVPAGSTTTYTVTLTNETDTQTLGSANVTSPTTFTVTGAHDLSAGTFTVSGNTVLLRNLNVAPGGSVSVQVDAQAPCHVSTYSWSSIAKQSNNFSGTPGNNLFLDAATSDTSTTLTGTCALSFQTEPASAQVGTNITGAVYDPAGPAVQVAVHDAGGLTISTGSDSTSTVSLAIQTNPAGGHLTVGSSSSSSGVTSFPSLSIDRSGLGYTLRASTTNPDVQPIDSTSFDIVDVGARCPAGPCDSGKDVKGSTTAQEVAGPGSPGDLLTLGIGLEPLDCAGYGESSAVVTFSVTGRSKTITVTLAKAAVTHSVSSYQVCYASPTAFVDRSGTLTNGPALLADCADVGNVAPCVLSRDPQKGGVQVAFAAPAGDPKGRL
jgi:hypothetical protein